MLVDTKFHGVIPPIPTILYKDGTLDREGMGNLIDFLIDAGVDGLFFLGSGGEFSQMSSLLRQEVAEFAVQYTDQRVPVLIGTGTSGTAETIELSLHASKIGADGVVIINPYYFPLTEESVYQHYADIAEAVELPIMLYNFPELTGRDLSPQLVTKLAETYPNIVGIKDTVQSVGHTRELILSVKSKRKDFAVFSGYDDHFLNTLYLGGDGSIPLTASFAPELSIGIYDSFKKGDHQSLVDYQRKLANLPLLYKLDSPFMNVAKEAIKLRGINVSTDVLPPVRALTKEKIEKIKDVLTEVLDEEYVKK